MPSSLGLGLGLQRGKTSRDPLVPGIVTLVALDIASDTGESSTDNITKTTTPNFLIDFAGSLAQDDVVEMRDGVSTVVSHTVSVGEASSATITLSTSLSAGARTLSARWGRSGHFGPWSAGVTITIDTTAPTLSSPGGTATSGSTADLSVSTNDGSGTLYGVVTTSATPPTTTQVKAGQDNSGVAAAFAFNQSVSATGAQTKGATGLTGGTTYTAHFMQEDVAGNQSNVSSSSTFATAGTFTLDWVSSATNTAGGSTINYGTLSIGPANANRIVAVSIADRNGSAAATVSSVSIGGNAAAQVSGAAGVIAGGLAHTDVWYLAVAAGTTAAISVTYSSSSTRSAVDVYSIVTTTAAPSAGTGTAASNGNSLTTSAFTVPAGGGALAVYGAQNPGVATDITWTNAVKDHTDIQMGGFTTVGSAKVNTTGSTTVTASISGAGTSGVAVSAAAWAP